MDLLPSNPVLREVLPGGSSEDDPARRYIREVYESDLGRTGVSDGEVDYWVGTGLSGNDLIMTMRDAAGLDNELYEDPAYSAFMRSLRARESEVREDLDFTRSRIERQRLLASDLRDRQIEQGTDRINQSAESRGMFRSGGRLRDLAENRADIDRNFSRQELGFADQEAEATRRATRQLAQGSRSRDEAEIAARNRLTQRSIQESL